MKKSPAPLLKKSALTTKVSPAPVLKKSPAAASRTSRRSLDTEEGTKRIEKILQMAKSLRENSEKESPTKGAIETSYMKKRDQKYQKKIGFSIGKKQSSPVKSLFDSNPFTKKASRFQKTLIATPSKFEIKVTKSPAKIKTSEPKTTRSGVRGKLGKPAPVKKMPQKKVSLRSKVIKKEPKKVIKEKVKNV